MSKKKPANWELAGILNLSDIIKTMSTNLKKNSIPPTINIQITPLGFSWQFKPENGKPLMLSINTQTETSLHIQGLGMTERQEVLHLNSNLIDAVTKLKIGSIMHQLAKYAANVETVES